MPDKDTMLAIRNLRKHRAFEVHREESGKHSVWYKGERVGTLAETPGDRRTLQIHLNDIGRKTGLEIDRKGRIQGTRMKIIHQRGGGQEPVLKLPPEMASELDQDDVLRPRTGLERERDIYISSGEPKGRPKLQFERPAPQPKSPEPKPAPAPAPPEPEEKEEAPVPEPEQSKTEEPKRRSGGAAGTAGRQKKRPSLKPEELKARRDVVVDFLYDHPSETFTADQIKSVLAELGVDMTKSGVWRMCEQLTHRFNRIRSTKRGRTTLYYVALDDRPLQPGQEPSAAPPAPPVAETPAPAPAPQEEPVAPAVEPAAPPAPPAEPDPMRAPQMHRTPPAPEEVKMSEPTTVNGQSDYETIRRLEKENLALRMLAKMKGLSDEDIRMALDMARMV